MRSYITSLLLLVSVSFLASCSEDPVSTSGYSIQEIFPLSVGNRWTLVASELDTSGAVVGRDTASLSVDSTTTINGLPGFYFHAFNDTRVLYYKGNDIYSSEGPSLPIELLLQYPMAAGEIAVIRDTTYEDSYRSRRTMRIVAENVQVTVPAGTFQCVQYELLSMYGRPSEFDTSSISHVYFSPKVGYIMEKGYDSYMDITKVNTISELISYTVK